jgi:hypothetical protein
MEERLQQFDPPDPNAEYIIGVDHAITGWIMTIQEDGYTWTGYWGESVPGRIGTFRVQIRGVTWWMRAVSRLFKWRWEKRVDA